MEIARRLLTADRAEEAWRALEAAEPRTAVRDARGCPISSLDLFERPLSPDHLRLSQAGWEEEVFRRMGSVGEWRI